MKCKVCYRGGGGGGGIFKSDVKMGSAKHGYLPLRYSLDIIFCKKVSKTVNEKFLTTKLDDVCLAHVSPAPPHFLCFS